MHLYLYFSYLNRNIHVQQEVFALHPILCFYFASFADATKKKIQWAFHIFSDWKVVCNAQNWKSNYRIGHLLEMSSEAIADALCPFILEVQKKTGEVYPSETLYEIIICLQLYMSMHGREVQLLSDDRPYVRIKNTLDNKMKELAGMGKVAPRIQAKEIDLDKENYLWEKGILGESNGRQLLNTILYIMGVQFGLRADQEHCNLRLGVDSQ